MNTLSRKYIPIYYSQQKIPIYYAQNHSNSLKLIIKRFLSKQNQIRKQTCRSTLILDENAD